jgi:hypothetical protein
MKYDKPAITLLGDARRLIECGLKLIVHLVDWINGQPVRDRDCAYDLDE